MASRPRLLGDRGRGGGGKYCGEPRAGAGLANDSISVMVPVPGAANGVITLTIQTTITKNATDHCWTKSSG